MKAIVLLSGGLDSAVTLMMALKECREVTALSFDYGQRHRIELARAKRLAEHLDHRIVKLDMRAIGGSALTGDIDVPKAPTQGIPVTYVPARNTIFIAYAFGLAEVLNAKEIWIGANAIDFSGYPDCRPGYFRRYQDLLNEAARDSVVTIRKPLIQMSKEEIIKRGVQLGVDFKNTNSCYDPIDSGACGACDSCRIRRAGFESAGIADPTVYR